MRGSPACQRTFFFFFFCSFNAEGSLSPLATAPASGLLTPLCHQHPWNPSLFLVIWQGLVPCLSSFTSAAAPWTQQIHKKEALAQSLFSLWPGRLLSYSPRVKPWVAPSLPSPLGHTPLDVSPSRALTKDTETLQSDFTLLASHFKRWKHTRPERWWTCPWWGVEI